jgi:8-oxo-dGTP diphosphatase
MFESTTLKTRLMARTVTQAPRRVENWQVRMHDLIGKGVAAARQRRRWTQEDAAREFRYHGLTAWRTSTVGSLEAGMRRPRLDEVVLMCAALGVGLDELLPDSDELIELGDGARMTSVAVRSVLAGSADEDTEASFPGADRLIDAIARARPERRRVEALLAPIARRAGWGLTDADWQAAFRTPSDAERHAARRLEVHPAQVRLAARAVWRRDFADERDARVGDPEHIEPRSRQARRGLVTRTMLGELRDYIVASEAAYTPTPEGRPTIVAAIVVSRLGVLIGRRNDREPLWTLIAGEVKPGERAEDALIREVKEETGLEVRAGEHVGSREHPANGRMVIYIAARPVSGTKVSVSDEAELAEVRWAGLPEVEELLPSMYGPVRDYLIYALSASAPPPDAGAGR